jgi:hypothetical protein
MTRQKSRDDARAELAASHVDGKTAADIRYRLGVYRRWCAAQGLPSMPPESPEPAYPGAEMVLLMFLFAHPAWSHSYASRLAQLVADEQGRAGYGDPRGVRTAQYLNAVKRREGGLRKGAPTDALTREQVNAIPERAAANVRPVPTWVVRLRGVVAVAEALGVDPTLPGGRIQRLAREAFVIRPDAVVITLTDEQGRTTRRRLDAELQPQMYESLVLALTAAGGEQPLAPPPDARRTLDQLVLYDNKRLLLAWRHAYPQRTAAVTASYGQAKALRAQIGESWTADRPEDRVWWLAQIDRWLWLRRRDVAYLLCGVVNARRHIELERLTIGDFEPTEDGGYRYEFVDKGARIAARQGARKLKKIVRVLDHVAGDDAPGCLTSCPACAMRAHLEVRTRSGAGPADPLFVGKDGEVLQLGGANDAIRRLTGLVRDLDVARDGTVRVFGTRTMRVTGTTLAWQSGMSEREIGDTVTGHSTEQMVSLYVRRHDPFSCDLTLSLDESQPSSRAA